MIGKSLGPYEILDKLGAGGMGDVYLAKDTRLGRSVAVKVLPEEYASDPERLARFEQEARAAAALNHPHIAAVFDVGESGGVHYMVQEHLEGQTLGDRLQNKGAMSTKAALDLAIEIVEALAAAHGAGIVHRDLKPPNIFVSNDGHAKVLDFGLAKLTEFAGIGGSVDSRSPTMVGTVAGQVMGTAGYMAPEQVEGEKIDHRADVFAFGCVLYEMISGRRAFAGKNVLDTLHKIANSEPQPLTEVSDQIPQDLHRIVRKCLAKEPNARYQTASDLAVDLRSLAKEVEKGTALPLGAVSTTLHQTATASTPKKWIGVALVAGVAAGIALSVLAVWPRLGAAPTDITFEITLPEGYVLRRGVAVSPDGREVVFSATDPDGRAGLFRRPLGDLAPTFITGSEGGQLPLYSPDGEWIVFNESDRLAKIPAEGGKPLELGTGFPNTTAHWAPDDTIVFENRGKIYRVSAAGGTAEVVAEGGTDPRYDTPFALGDGRHILIGVREGGTWSVAVLDTDSGEIRKLVEDAVGPGYLPTGHLTFGRDDTVWAQAFDVDSLEVSGTPFPLRSGVSMAVGRPQLAVAPNGTMTYVPGFGGGEGDSLVWLERNGEITETGAPAPGRIQVPRLSPDEQLVAMAINEDGGTTQVYTYDRRRSTFSLLRGLDETSSFGPVWTPDGEWIYYAQTGIDGGYDIHRAPVDRSAPPELFLERPGLQSPSQASPDGKYLLFRDDQTDSRSDIWLAPLDGGEPEPFLAEPHHESQATFSPDGKWVAFMSDASGDYEIYYTPFPGPGRITQISNDVASAPVWAKDGSRIYYYSSGGGLMEAEVVAGSELEFDAPRQVVRDTVVPRSGLGTPFDSARDGRLVMSNSRLSGRNSSARPSLVVVLHWFDEVERLAPKR